MKKRLIKNLLLVLTMVVLCFAVGVMASAQTWGEYEYIILDDGTVEISKYIGDGIEVEIPSEIDGKMVTSIGKSAFENCIYLEEIVLPESLISIEYCAFVGCVSLKEINLPSNLKTIGQNSFAYCVSLREFTIPEGVERIDEGALSFCFYLENIYNKSMNAKLNIMSMNISDFMIDGLSVDECAELFGKAAIGDEVASSELEKYITEQGDIIHLSTIYAHSNSSAEAYAIEYDVPYELVHFYEGEWINDDENGVRYRKCIHCDEKEIGVIEPENSEEPESNSKEKFFVNLFDIIYSLIELLINLFAK